LKKPGKCGKICSLTNGEKKDGWRRTKTCLRSEGVEKVRGKIKVALECKAKNGWPEEKGGKKWARFQKEGDPRIIGLRREEEISPEDYITIYRSEDRDEKLERKSARGARPRSRKDQAIHLCIENCLHPLGTKEGSAAKKHGKK